LRRFPRFALAAWFLGYLGASGCGESEPPKAPQPELTFPASWAGVWRVHFPNRDCQTDSLLGMDVFVDSLCAGETLEEFLGITQDQIDIVCTGTITDTEFASHCTGRSEQFGVVLTVTADVTGSRQDSLMTGGGTALLRYQSGNHSETDCYEISFDAVRLGPVGPGCSGSTTPIMAKPLTRALARRPFVQP